MTSGDAISSTYKLAWSSVLVLLVLLTFGRSVGHEFFEGDDQDMLLHQPVVLHPTPQRLARLWTGSTLGLYTPLSYSLWTAVGTIAHQPGIDPPLSPRVFHGLNVLLHAITSVIVLCALSDLLRIVRGHALPADGFAAFVGAAVFALHPLQVEAIAWVSGMNNLLAGLFVMAAIAAHLRFYHTGRPRWAVVTAALFVAAMLSKPTAIVMPLMIASIDLLLLGRRWRSALIELAAGIALAVPFVIAGRFAQPAQTIFAPPLLQRFVVVADTLGFYTEKFFVPWPIIIDYARAPQFVLASHGTWHVWLFLAMAVLATIGGPWAWRRSGSIVGRAIVAGAATAAAGVAIVSGIVPFAFQLCSTVANRYVYLSLFGAGIIGAFVVSSTLDTPRLTSWRRGVVRGMSVTLIIALAVTACIDIGNWRSTETVWNVALHYNPHDWLALNAVGNIQRKKGNLTEAEACYLKAIEYSPGNGVAYFNYGNLVLNRDPEKAIALYHQAVDRDFDNPSVRDNLAVALAGAGRLDEAAAMAQWLLDQNSEDVNALIALANVRALQGDGPAALQLFRQALQLDPSSTHAADGVQQLEALLK